MSSPAQSQLPSALSKLLPQPQNDPRYTYRSALLNGYTYTYIHAPVPSGITKHGTIVLIHGFPDLSFTWRNQIPILTNLGLEVIAPDCLGYGRSDSPPTSSLQSYTYARIADDIATLCSQLGLAHILLGGHDWGGAIVYRIALHKPTLVKAVFSVCTPYDPPRPVYMPLAQLVAKRVPNFAYQLHFVSGEIEAAVQTPDQIRTFLNALYGARALNDDTQAQGTKKRDESAFTSTGPVNLSLLPTMGQSRLLSKDEMDFYVTEYSRHGVNGPLNWYRTREANFINDLHTFFGGPGSNIDKTVAEGNEKLQIKQPTLFIHATRDATLLEWMGRGMDALIPQLTKRKVEAGHWVLWEKPEEVNGILGEWVRGVLKELGGSVGGKGGSKL